MDGDIEIYVYNIMIGNIYIVSGFFSSRFCGKRAFALFLLSFQGAVLVFNGLFVVVILCENYIHLKIECALMIDDLIV